MKLIVFNKYQVCVMLSKRQINNQSTVNRILSCAVAKKIRKIIIFIFPCDLLLFDALIIILSLHIIKNI